MHHEEGLEVVVEEGGKQGFHCSCGVMPPKGPRRTCALGDAPRLCPPMPVLCSSIEIILGNGGRASPKTRASPFARRVVPRCSPPPEC